MPTTAPPPPIRIADGVYLLPRFIDDALADALVAAAEERVNWHLNTGGTTLYREVITTAFAPDLARQLHQHVENHAFDLIADCLGVVPFAHDLPMGGAGGWVTV